MNLIANTIDNQSRLISVENHFKNGGLGDLISETFTRAVHRIGLSREFITEYGSYEELREVAGMSTDQILQKIKAITNE
jgi:transketolase C-terminal domain/subunit